MELDAELEGRRLRTVASRARAAGVVTFSYAAAAAAGVVSFVLGGVLLAVTIPYHDWDSFAFGAWSRDLSAGGTIDPIAAGVLGSARPVFYALQGAVWSVTGVSFTAGRLLSLAFGLLLVAGVALLAQVGAPGHRARAGRATLAVVVTLAIAPLAQETLAGKSDVPAAAMLAVTAWLAIRARRTSWAAAGVAVACFGTMLTKPTVTVPLALLAVVTVLVAGTERRARLVWSAGPLAAGLLAGVIYQAVMAARFDTGLLAYLRSGTTDGLWGQRAADERWHALLRLDAFGPGLRVPLGFALVYGLARVAGLPHRVASFVALPATIVWATAGPSFVDGAPGAFSTWEAGLTFVGFALAFAVAAFVPAEVAPSRSHVAVLFALGAAPFAVWLYATPYAARLAAAAWPGLAVLVALCLWCAVKALEGLGPLPALAPLPVLAAACWMAFATFDGLHGPQWVEYRSLGIDGVRDRDRTTNIVLPSVQSALAVVESRLGDGRLRTVDPRFAFFLPGRVDTGAALHCADLDGYAVYVFDTSDESAAIAREQGGLATAAEWASCGSPELEQLTDGSNGFAVFAVHG